MDIMDFIPQFGNNTDVSGYGDDNLAQMELKRKLKLAQALQEQETPQGQIVGGRYVAPSWTQNLANMAGKLVGAYREKKAVDEYGQYQKGKQQKLASLLDDLQKGKQVEQPVDYNEAGNMPGMMQTVRKPYSQQEFMSKVGAIMPETLPKFLQAQFEQYNKDKTPIKGSAGDVFFDPVTHEQIFSVPSKPQAALSNIQPDPITGKFYGYDKDKNQIVEVPGQAVTPKPEVPKAPPSRTRNISDTMQVEEVMTSPPTKENPQGTWQATGKPYSRFAPKDTSNVDWQRSKQLRDDFQSLPEVKNWNVIQPILVSARQAAKDTSGGSDLNLIYAMGKVLDPNSVVREGELQLAGNTGSFGQRIMGYYKSVANGGRLPAPVKQDLLNQIENRAKSSEQLYNNTKKQYTNLAAKYGVDPSDLFVEGITAPSAAQAELIKPPPPAMSPVDKQAVDWLKANPNHPKANAVRETLKKKGLL